MFDIGFFELLVIAVVGLLVIGPERLPATIRTAALWWGRIKRNIRETRADIEKQIGADEIRRELHNEEVMRSLESLRHTTKEVEQQVRDAASEAERDNEPPVEHQGDVNHATHQADSDTPPKPSAGSGHHND